MRHAHFELNTSTEGAECGLVRLIGACGGSVLGSVLGSVVVRCAVWLTLYHVILKEKASQYPELAFVGLGFGSVSLCFVATSRRVPAASHLTEVVRSCEL